MKKIFMALMLCLVSIIVLNSCKSQAEKNANEYFNKNIKTEIVAAVATTKALGVDVKLRSVNMIDFNNTPDTFYKYQLFEKQLFIDSLDMKLAKEIYDIYDEVKNDWPEKFNESKHELDECVVKYNNTLDSISKYKQNKEIDALIFQCNIKTKSKIGGEKCEKITPYEIVTDREYNVIDMYELRTSNIKHNTSHNTQDYSVRKAIESLKE